MGGARKYKIKEDKEMIVEGKTASGFEFAVDSEKLKEWRFLKCMASLMSEDNARRVVANVEMPEMLLGQRGLRELEAFLQEKNGRVLSEDVLREAKNVLDLLQEREAALKN